MESILDLGVAHVVGEFLRQTGIADAIGNRMKTHSYAAPHADALLAMVTHQLDHPGLKLGCHEHWLKQIWLPQSK